MLKETWKYLAIKAMKPVDMDCSRTITMVTKTKVGLHRREQTRRGNSEIQKLEVWVYDNDMLYMDFLASDLRLAIRKFKDGLIESY